MTGVRFYTDSVSDVGGVGTPIYLHGRIDRKRSDFDYIFRPVYSRFTPLVCAMGRGLPNDDPMVIATIPGWHIVSARWLNEDGKEFKDDWFSCVLFPDDLPPVAVANLTNHFWRNPRTFLDSPAQVVLQNWDGAYWQIFDKDQRTLETLRTVHRNDPHLKMYWVPFEDEYPSPSNRPLKPA